MIYRACDMHKGVARTTRIDKSKVLSARERTNFGLCVSLNTMFVCLLCVFRRVEEL